MGKIRDILRTMEYGPSPESNEHVAAWLAAHAQGFGHFIDGEFTKPGALFEVANPANGKLLAKVTQGSAAALGGGAAPPRKPSPSWPTPPVHTRPPHLYAPPRHIQKRDRFLAVLET